jgi:hypothetical protein
MSGWQEALPLILGIVGPSFALVRLSIASQRATMGRFVALLERNSQRLEETNGRLAEAVSSLQHGVGENTRILRQVAERLHFFSDVPGGGP